LWKCAYPAYASKEWRYFRDIVAGSSFKFYFDDDGFKVKAET